MTNLYLDEPIVVYHLIMRLSVRNDG